MGIVSGTAGQNTLVIVMSLNLNDAAMAGNVEEVLIRLNLGEDVNQKCYPRYSTPLHDAVCCGRQEVVKILLDRGANVNEDIEKMLLEMGAVETVEVPKKVSIVDVDPPWVRRVSRREPAA